MEEDSTDLLTGLAKWLAYLEPMLANVGNYTWVGDDATQFWQFLRRGIVKRQQEALKTTLNMVDEGHGHFAVTFLRPAYEELIWIEYLGNNISIAPELSYLLGKYEPGVSLNAQNEYLDNADMAAVGFTQRYVKIFAAITRQTEKEIKEIGRNLGWPQGRQSVFPSMWFLSRKVGREKDYKFLYHATSRFVHFSAQEVYRRVWGTKGEVTITSGKYSHYWQDFAMYWGFRIFIELIAQCDDLLGEFEISEEEHERMMQLLKKFHAIPIITTRELESWN